MYFSPKVQGCEAKPFKLPQFRHSNNLASTATPVRRAQISPTTISGLGTSKALGRMWRAPLTSRRPPPDDRKRASSGG
jgi:hypothetical protein